MRISRLFIFLCVVSIVAIPLQGEFVAAPRSTQQFVAHCVDLTTGAIIPDCGLQLYNGYYIETGGHYHEGNPRPQSGPDKAWGTISPTSGWYPGYSGLTITYTASRVGQIEWLDACAYYCESYDILVAYTDIFAYFPNNHAVFIGATSTHPSNHWGTSQLNAAINAVAQAYYNEFSACSQYEKIGVNDIALPYGGVFDYQNTWKPPHGTHDRGRAVDVRYRPNRPTLPNSVIRHPVALNRFLEICRENGLFYAIRENDDTDNDHLHCATSSSGQ